MTTITNSSNVSKKKKHNKYSLELEHVFVGYSKVPVIYDISFKVKKGEILGIIGNSGAGKSTAVKCMTAQLKPMRGICKTANIDVKNHPDKVQLQIGYVPQLEHMSLYYEFNPMENALFFGRHFNLSDDVIKNRCREIMDILGLGEEEFLRKPIKNLSGGEQKRVSIMVGLINRPEILFLDEPTTGLDPHLRIEVLNYLSNINKQYKTTLILISHDLELVDYCDKIVVFNEGWIVDQGDPWKLTKSLPNNGEALIVQFDKMNGEFPEKIEKLEEIKYILHSGRNKFKLFITSKENVNIILQKIANMGCKFSKHYFDTCVFLDYFRVQSLYVYPEETQRLKNKISRKYEEIKIK
ncbi:MAG: Energy-coupling factor transporter ATP-binding protein EcfA2 [Promethearchaeota archaeon]|nr:MAG: Energy-coupling factor transporter ATP-binding protein EcfA2 [Candidatus Lokiarchaeota archaeon]